MLFLFLIFTFFSLFSVFAVDDPNGKITDIKNQINDLNKKISELQEKKRNLKEQIIYMDSQIKLTGLKISETNSEIKVLEGIIDGLSKKITVLNNSLDELSLIFIQRVSQTYKEGRTNWLDFFFAAENFSDFFKRTQYLKVAQINDRKVMLTMEEIKANYDKQKEEKEKKQKELEVLKQKLNAQNKQLKQQKSDKERLLVLTQSDEKKFQEMMTQALAELEAIQAIVAGQGIENKVGAVKESEKIATVISGASPCSTGTHLHFEVRDGETVQNPFSYLSSVTLENKSGGDEFSFGGTWRWPLSPPIELNQGYGGNTWWIRMGGAWYRFHTGIDIGADSQNVFAVREGDLYNGSIKCGSGFLRYVRVKHKDSNFSTYYLHVNYEKV